jgi:altronate hydrolase
MPNTANMVVLSTADNVGIAIADIEDHAVAQSLDGRRVETGEAIPLGHKVALRPIASGESIVRFGVPVGIATLSIDAGRLVHIHNVRSQYIDNDENHYE